MFCLLFSIVCNHSGCTPLHTFSMCVNLTVLRPTCVIFIFNILCIMPLENSWSFMKAFKVSHDSLPFVCPIGDEISLTWICFSSSLLKIMIEGMSHNFEWHNFGFQYCHLFPFQVLFKIVMRGSLSKLSFSTVCWTNYCKFLIAFQTSIDDSTNEMKFTSFMV